MSTSLCTGWDFAFHTRGFTCLLDASKASDLVNHEILVKRLLDKHLPSYLYWFLLTWYKDQHMRVRWAAQDS